MSLYNYIFASKEVVKNYADADTIEDVNIEELHEKAKFYQYDDRLDSPKNILDAFKGYQDYIKISKENYDFLQSKIQEI